ncbi:hypothetical protein [Sphingomonas sp.]|uniref:hypothetical protein n=1 Tax=Sphingomonas sp. TaxID=28214 RepID=UPI003CC55ABC
MILLHFSKPRARVRARLLPLSLLAVLGGCSGWHGTADERQINTLLLKVLTADGRNICVDSGARGEPLAIYRDMLPAPEPARRPLGWTAPRPLDPGRNLSGRDLIGSELQGEHVVLPERPSLQGQLSVVDQGQLNGYANRASLLETSRPVRLAETADAPHARVRWWGWNRLTSSCHPVYTVSRTIIVDNVAFVSVTAAHQGSTYAFRRTGTAWAPYAKWSTWLY